MRCDTPKGQGAMESEKHNRRFLPHTSKRLQFEPSMLNFRVRSPLPTVLLSTRVDTEGISLCCLFSEAYKIFYQRCVDEVDRGMDPEEVRSAGTEIVQPPVNLICLPLASSPRPKRSSALNLVRFFQPTVDIRVQSKNARYNPSGHRRFVPLRGNG